MKFRHSASIVAGGAMVAVVLAAPPAAGQSARTAWGDPDLQGLWNMTHGTPLERPEGVTAAVLSEEERATRRADRSSAFFTPRDGDPGFYNEFWFEWGKEDNRTAMIDDPPDGRIPMNPGVREREDATRAARREKAESPDTWLDMSVYDRCITRWALPALPTNYNNNWNILQTPGYVVIFQEMIHDARIIPLDGRPHIGAGIRQWLGDSRGRWEGDTLVVETTNFNGKHNFNGSREGLRLVEADHAGRRRQPGLAVDAGGPVRLEPPVDRLAAPDEHRGAALRVRLSRGELRAVQHPRRRAGRGGAGAGEVAGRETRRGTGPGGPVPADYSCSSA